MIYSVNNDLIIIKILNLRLQQQREMGGEIRGVFSFLFNLGRNYKY